MRALPERFGCDAREPGFHRGGVRAGCRQLRAEQLEGVEPELAKALSLDQHPVVVPVGQEVPTEHDRLRCGRASAGPSLRSTCRARAPREMQVDGEPRCERQVISRRVDEAEAEAAATARGRSANWRSRAPPCSRSTGFRRRTGAEAAGCAPRGTRPGAGFRAPARRPRRRLRAGRSRAGRARAPARLPCACERGTWTRRCRPSRGPATTVGLFGAAETIRVPARHARPLLLPIRRNIAQARGRTSSRIRDRR